MRRGRALPVLLAVASGAGLASVAGGCTAEGRRGRVYEGPRDGAHERGVGAAPGAPAAPGDAVDPADVESVTGTPQVVGTGATPEDPSRRSRRAVEDDVAAVVRERLAAAREALDGGADEEALALLDGALALDPPEELAERARALKAEARARRLEDEVLRVDVRGVREYVPFGEAVDVIVRLRNVGTADVVISPPSGSGKEALSGSTLALRVRRRDRDVYAAELVRTWNRLVPLVEGGDPAVRVPPEGSLEVRVRIPAEDAGAPLSGLRVLEVEGDLRAGRIEAGLSEPLGRVRIRPGRVVVLPSNYEPLAADPVGSLRKAAAGSAPVHLLVAAEFVAPDDRPSAVAVLAEVLATGSADMMAAALNALRHVRAAAAGTALRPLVEPLFRALRAHPDRPAGVVEGLSVVTGVSLAPDVRLWEDWWRRESAGPGGLVPAEDGSPSGSRGPAR